MGIAFVRGYVRENTSDLGNFWVDLVRSLLWVLLPLSLLGSLLLIAQGDRAGPEQRVHHPL